MVSYFADNDLIHINAGIVSQRPNARQAANDNVLGRLSARSACLQWGSTAVHRGRVTVPTISGGMWGTVFFASPTTMTCPYQWFAKRDAWFLLRHWRRPIRGGHDSVAMSGRFRARTSSTISYVAGVLDMIVPVLTLPLPMDLFRGEGVGG